MYFVHQIHLNRVGRMSQASKAEAHSAISQGTPQRVLSAVAGSVQPFRWLPPMTSAFGRGNNVDKEDHRGH